MTSLDQAFIKAYMRQGGVPVPAALDSAGPVRLDDVLAAPSAAVGRGSPDPAPNRSPQTTPVGPADADSPTDGSHRPDESPDRGRRALSISALGIEEATVPAACNPDEDTGTGFRPMLQVDRLDWPAVSDRLLEAVPKEIGRLAAAIRRAAGLGRRVIGLAGGAAGEGCTTLVATVARYLADRDVGVVLVDADDTEPGLAGQLGLLVEVGWEDVAGGQIALEDALIESDGTGLAVLPRRGTQTEIATTNRLPPAGLLDQLRHHYDVVLVDLGAQLVRQVESETPTGRWLDAVVWVHNAGPAGESIPTQLRSRVRGCGLCELGTVENFAARAAS